MRKPPSELCELSDLNFAITFNPNSQGYANTWNGIYTGVTYVSYQNGTGICLIGDQGITK